MGEFEEFKSLYQKCKSGIHNVSFDELCTLAGMAGWQFDRQKGSHQIFLHPKYPGIMNFQPVKGKAKPFQIRQLLRFISENDLLKDGDKK